VFPKIEASGIHGGGRFPGVRQILQKSKTTSCMRSRLLTKFTEWRICDVIKSMDFGVMSLCPPVGLKSTELTIHACRSSSLTCI
jgi:hypothetical protein